MRQLLLSTLLVCAFVYSEIGGASGAPDTERQPLQAGDIFNLEFASDPQFVADGRSLVYVRNFMDIMKDKKRSNLWWVDLDGGNHRPITSGNVNDTQPRLSPEGGRLAYISNKSGRKQIYVRRLATGEELQVAELTVSPKNISWSPDGRLLAFEQLVPASSKPLVKMPSKPKDAEWAPVGKIIDKAIYRFDGAGYIPQGFSQIFVVPAGGGQPRQLTTATYEHKSPLSWSSSGNKIFFSANPYPSHELRPIDTELYSVEVASGEVRALTSRNGPDNSPVLSPDGRWLAYLGYDDNLMAYRNQRVYVMRPDGSDRRVLTNSLDRRAEKIAWGSGSRNIYFQYDDEGSTRIAMVDLDGVVKNLAGNLGGTAFGRPYGRGSFVVNKVGQIAYTRTSTQELANIVVTSDNGESPKQITDINRDVFSARVLGEAEEVWYESSFDGQKIQGWVIKPPSFDPEKKYPFILEIHGGPYSNYGARFSPELQLYAAAGYVVLYTNPRGSTSYGEDFANLIQHDYPGRDYDDLMSGVDHVIGQGYVDTERLYVTGGSGGGALTAVIVGKTDRFQAAVVAKPVMNWTSFTLYTDSTPKVAKYFFGEMPWENPEAYWRRSPLSLVGNINTPTMLIAGEEDYRTPTGESEQLYQALRLRNVESIMLRIPGATHRISDRPSRLISKSLHIINWFDRHGGKR